MKHGIWPDQAPGQDVTALPLMHGNLALAFAESSLEKSRHPTGRVRRRMPADWIPRAGANPPNQTAECFPVKAEWHTTQPGG